MNDFSIGIIPLPGMINHNGVINAKEFAKLGKVPDRSGYTKAGRDFLIYFRDTLNPLKGIESVTVKI